MGLRVAELEETVARLSSIVDRPLPPVSADRQQDAGATEDHDAPLEVIRDAIVTQEPLVESDNTTSASIVQKGIVTIDEAEMLIICFLQNYGRWIAFPEAPVAGTHAREIRNNPLLMCASALVATRHIFPEGNTDRASALFAEAKLLLGQSMLRSPQDLRFFQAVLILSLWSTTAGQMPLSLDAWLVTGYALQQGLVSDALQTSDSSSDSLEKTHVRNHLCLSHMHACVSMRRPAMLSDADVRQAKGRLRSQDESNFEVRMVAELDLYWSIHECCIAASVKLPQAQAALSRWMNEWAFLFEQPRHHLLRLGYSFANLMIYEHALSNKSAAVRESLVTDMLRLCAEILHDAEESTDDRTEHLTDHIYHVIAFAAITMCRLMYKYSGQIKTLHRDAFDGQVLIRNSVRWLRSVGQPCHIGRTMGDIIAAVHRGLFPDQSFTPAGENMTQRDFYDGLEAPDMFGLDTSFDWDSLLPDWQSLASDNATQGFGLEMG